MASLTAEQKADVVKEFMSRLSARRRQLANSVDKPCMCAMIDSIDAWLDTVETAAYAAIPTPLDTELTAEEQIEILTMCVERRFKAVLGG